jgi:hypothetical protein
MGGAERAALRRVERIPGCVRVYRRVPIPGRSRLVDVPNSELLFEMTALRALHVTKCEVHATRVLQVMQVASACKNPWSVARARFELYSAYHPAAAIFLFLVIGRTRI